jgi:type IV pilus assembly protein PilE
MDDTAPPKAHRMSGAGRGFSLVELMIAVAIVAILAGIAYPSYRDQIERSRRADAQTVLMQAAQFMERIYTENGCYNPDKSCSVANDPGGVTMPYTKSPIDGGETYYAITVTALTRKSFTLRATPQGSEAGAGLLEITDTGERRWDRDRDGSIGAGEDNWDR